MLKTFAKACIVNSVIAQDIIEDIQNLLACDYVTIRSADNGNLLTQVFDSQTLTCMTVKLLDEFIESDTLNTYNNRF